MKKILLSLLLLPMVTQASNLSELYWSTYACDGYIYHFDDNKGEYKIYTRLDVQDEKNGKYKSYQLTEGKMEHKEGGVYILTSKDLNESMTLDFGDMNQAVLKLNQSGRRGLLIQCNREKTKQLINEAENHFKSCPKNVLNCKSL